MLMGCAVNSIEADLHSTIHVYFKNGIDIFYTTDTQYYGNTYIVRYGRTNELCEEFSETEYDKALRFYYNKFIEKYHNDQ